MDFDDDFMAFGRGKSVDFKSILKHEVNSSDDSDDSLTERIDDRWWMEDSNGSHERAHRLGEMEKAVNRRNARPLTASAMLKSWTPDPINEENRIKTSQVKFSPIVVRDNKKFKTHRWWKPSRAKKFFKKYKTDLPLFSSRVRWAGTKLGEVIVATREEKLPCRARTVVSSDLLLALKEHFDAVIPQANRLVQDILSSIFPGVDPSGNVDEMCTNIKCSVCFDNGGAFVCNACKKRFCFKCFMTLKECLNCLRPIETEGDRIRLSLKSHVYPPGTQQQLSRFRLSNFLAFQTWFEFTDINLKSLRFELGFDPAKREFEKKMAEERRKNIAVLNRSTKRWQMSIVGIVFRRWRDALVKVKGAQQKMVKMMYRLKGISTRDVFKGWRTFYRRDQINPVKEKTLTMEERIIAIESQLKRVNKRIRQIEQRKSMTVGVITALNIDVNKANDTLNAPNRQPKTLQLLLKYLLQSMNTVIPFVRNQNFQCANELTRRGIGTHRISTFVPEEEDIHSMITKITKSWDSTAELEARTPHVDEDTAYPFHCRVSRLLLLWEHYLVKDKGYNKIEDYEQFLGGTRYIQMLKEVSKYHNFDPEYEIEKRLADSSLQSLSVDDRCQVIYDVVKVLQPKVVFLTHDDYLPDEVESPVSPKKKSISSANVARSPGKSKKKRKPKVLRKMTTIYMGEKVEMEDDTEQRHFAFLAQIFMTHKAFQSGSPAEGDDAWRNDTLDNLLEYYGNLAVAIKTIVARTPPKIQFSKCLKDLQKPIETIKKYKESLVEPVRDLSARYQACILERQTMYAFTDRLLYLVWSSIYLAVLGRNTSVEEDVDDGSFTALDKAQIADLFKRLPSRTTGSRGLTASEIADEMKEIHEFLRFHLRNSRQIFDHYSAAGMF